MEMTQEVPPTLEDVVALEERLEGLRGRREHARARLGELADGITTLHAEGRESTPEADTLREERRDLQDEIGELNAAVPAVEAKLAELRAAASVEAARKRLIGLSRAHGSLRQEVSQDDARILEAARVLALAVQRRTDRLRRLATLAVEGRILSWRFGLEEPTLPALEPNRGEQPLHAVRVAAAGLSDLTASKVPQLSTSHVASAGENERRLSRLRALERYFESHGMGHLTPETAAILAAAGDPDMSAIEAQARQDRESRAQTDRRESAAMYARHAEASGASQA